MKWFGESSFLSTSVFIVGNQTHLGVCDWLEWQACQDCVCNRDWDYPTERNNLAGPNNKMSVIWEKDQRTSYSVVVQSAWLIVL